MTASPRRTDGHQWGRWKTWDCGGAALGHALCAERDVRLPRLLYTHAPKGARASLAGALNVLRAVGTAVTADALPEADADERGEGKEDAESDGEAPDGLDLVAGWLVDGDEGEVREGLGNGAGAKGDGVVEGRGQGGVGLDGESGAVEA